MYTTSFYWVITTFSSVGYGDVYAVELQEYGFAMFVEMLGICFFGYLIGLFQSILQQIGGQDQMQEQ